MRIYTCAPTPPVPRPAWASAAGSRATTPPGPIRHSAIGRPMRSTNHRRSRGLLRHRSVWQHDRHYSPQEDRPELRSLSRLSKLGGPAQRGSFDHLNDRTAAHVLSAFASDAALILAHQEVAGAPGEIPAVPTLMEDLGLTGVLFTADALHCQKDSFTRAAEMACWSR